MKGDYDVDQEEQVLIGVKQKTIQDINEVKDRQLEIQSLRIMHSPDLTSMLGLEKFRNLVHLNLSQNNIEKIEGLENSFYLETLNLSGNRIRVIQNLQTLKNLIVLNLSYNKVISLQYLQIFKGEEYCLKIIDFRCNQLSDLKEITFIQGILTLQEANFDSPKKSNQFCTNKQSYHRAILSLQNCPNLKIIDKAPIDDLEKLVFTNKQHVIDENKEIPKRKPLNIMSPQKPLPDWVEREAQYRVEILQMQNKIEDMLEAQQQLLHKFECNEKYWTAKCQNLETQVLDYQKEQQDAKRETNQMRKDLSNAQQLYDEEKKERQSLVVRKEKKDEIIENLQNRVNDLMQENGRLQKETSIRIDEFHKMKEESSEKQKKINEIKISLKQSESQLQTFHQKAVEQASQSLQKQEEQLSRYEQLHQENKTLSIENGKSKQRTLEILELCREWENKYDQTLVEHSQIIKEKVTKLEQENYKILQATIADHEKEKFQLDIESKRLQDQLEEEVRKVLMENIEKYRLLKQAFEEKTKKEIELKQVLQVSLHRNQEYETLIQELQNTLLKIRKEVADYLVQKNELITDHTSKMQICLTENSQQQQIIEKLQSQLRSLEQQVRMYIDQNDNFQIDNEKYKTKAKNLIQIEAELEELQTTLTVKNKMLDDKNDTIDDLKSLFENLKSSEQNATEDYNRLLRRYERQNQIIEELEGQLNNLQEEYDTKSQELKERKNVIHVFEQELEEIKEKQENEMQSLRAEIQDKDHNLLDLIKLLDDARDNLKRRDVKVKEQTIIVIQLEKRLQEIDNQYEKHLMEKEKEINYLRQRLEEAQDELKSLISEVEKQKRAAKENLDNLHKVFNL